MDRRPGIMKVKRNHWMCDICGASPDLLFEARVDPENIGNKACFWSGNLCMLNVLRHISIFYPDHKGVYIRVLVCSEEFTNENKTE